VNRRTVLARLAAGLVVAIPSEGVALGAGTKAPIIEISVIHAMRSDASTSIDPQLRDLPQLTRQQPFIRYNVFKLLDRKQLHLEKAKPVAYGLVDGRTLQVTLADITSQKNEDRYHVRAEIAGLGKKEFLKLLEVTAGTNEPFFVGGQSYQGGTLFLELVIRD
jgi:hypothetical protein